MKKALSIILFFTLFTMFAAFPAEAKILHQCHYCGGDGIYTCDAKDCKGGKVTCGRCNGTGKSTEKCAECGGTGKCRLCQGSGKRTGDSTIACDNCKGTGKCQGGPGWGPCTGGYYYNKCSDCNGEGVVWHNSEWCVYARNHGGKCPICKGTGYEGDGVEGTPNDGISNVPRAGDGIYYLDGSYSVYGGSSSDGSSQKNSSNTDDTTSQNNSNTDKTDNLLPEDKHATIYLGASSADSDNSIGQTATGVVRYQNMTDEQKAAFDRLTDEQLNKLLLKVRDIISTAKIGKISTESKNSVDAFCKANGIKNTDDAGILPVSFDGHVEIGFPILVRVEVDPGFFDGSKPLHIFHIKEDGSIIQIPDKDINWHTNEEDGRVNGIEFYTDSFSDFLLSDLEGLVIPTDIQTRSDKDTDIARGSKNSIRGMNIFAVVMILALIAAVAGVFVLKKRKPDNLSEKIQEHKEFKE